MNRDILKNPTLCRAKNSNKPRVHGQLVRWIPHTGDGQKLEGRSYYPRTPEDTLGHLYLYVLNIF